jgi:hypothetical protein
VTARKPSWRIIGEYRGYKKIGFFLDDVKQCTFTGIFDGWNSYKLLFHTREIGGVVPGTRRIYLADIEKKPPEETKE